MDIGCLEVVVPRKDNPFMKFLRVFLIMLCVAFIFLCMVSTWGIGTLIALVIGVACGVGAFFVGRNVNIEFEYSYVEKELRIAKIINKENRKSLGKYDLEKMEIAAPIQSIHLDNYNHKDLKTIDYTSGVINDPDDRYVMFFSDCKVMIEATEDLVNAMRQAEPHKVYRD